MADTPTRLRRALADSSRRPSVANLAVAVAYALVGVLSLVVASLVDAAWGGLRVLYGVAFAGLYLLNSYGYHWHAKYTFEQPSRCFVLGSVGAVVGLTGLVVQFAVPGIGVVLAVLGVGSNVLGNSWGTFVYTYRTYAPN